MIALALANSAALAVNASAAIADAFACSAALAVTASAVMSLAFWAMSLTLVAMLVTLVAILVAFVPSAALAVTASAAIASSFALTAAPQRQVGACREQNSSSLYVLVRPNRCAPTTDRNRHGGRWYSILSGH